MMMTNDKESPVTILLTRREQYLIIKYGYPFEDIEKQIKQADNTDLLSVTDVPFSWERVIVNLNISGKENAENEGNEGLDVVQEMSDLIDKILEKLGERLVRPHLPTIPQ